MTDEIVLEVRQDLDRDGWEDEGGTVHYDSHVATPFGLVGNLETVKAGRDVVITAAPAVILVRHGFPTHWSSGVTGVSIDQTFAGVEVMTVRGRNGEVRYQLDPRPVRWSDREDPIPFFVAQLIHSEWQEEPQC